MNQRLADLAVGIDLRQTRGAEAAERADVTKGRQLYDQLHRTLDDMKGTEKSFLRERERRSRNMALATQTVIVGGGILAIGVAALAVIAIRRDFAGRQRAEQALRGAAQQLEQRVRQRTVELAHLNETLAHSERRLRALIMASSDVVYRMSADWSEMHRLEGRDFLADISTAEPSWLQKYIHPDDQPQVMAVIDEAIRARHVFELEHRVLRMDGSLGWTFSRAIPLFTQDAQQYRCAQRTPSRIRAA